MTTASDGSGKRHRNPSRWLPQSACARWTVGAAGAALLLASALLLLLSSDWLFADVSGFRACNQPDTTHARVRTATRTAPCLPYEVG
jgi:hypothetical protein